MRQLESNESPVNIAGRYLYLRATQYYWPNLWHDAEQYLVGVFESSLQIDEKEVLAEKWFIRNEIYDEWLKIVFAESMARWSFNPFMRPSENKLETDWFHFPLEEAAQPVLSLQTCRASRKFYPLGQLKQIVKNTADNHKADLLAYLRANGLGYTESRQDFKKSIMEDVERQIDEYLNLDEQSFSGPSERPAIPYHARWTALFQKGKSAAWIRLNDQDAKGLTRQAFSKGVSDFAESIGLTPRKRKYEHNTKQDSNIEVEDAFDEGFQERTNGL